MVGLATLTIFAFRDLLPHINIVSFVYLVPVLLAAIWWGPPPAVLAAVASALTADYLFYPPLYSFWIDDPQNVADFIAFLIVAIGAGTLAAKLRQRERQINALYDYSKQLAACFTTTSLIQATQDYLSKYLGLATRLIPKEKLGDPATTTVDVPDAIWRAAALESRRDTTIVTDDTTRQAWLIRPIAFGHTECLVFVNLGINATDRGKRALNQRIDAVLTEATANLTRLDLAKAADEFNTQTQSDALKNALVTAVSHDLRSPLVSILGSLSVVEGMSEIRDNARAQSLLATARDQAASLDGEIQNLIDATRIGADATEPKLEPTDLVDIVRSAIEKRRTQLAKHRLVVSLPRDLPLIRAQSGLVENAVAQLLENAAKYSPAGSEIRIQAQPDPDWVVLTILDQGSGLTTDEAANAGRRPFRSARHLAIRGSGLGLWLANTFIAANGGKLEAESSGLNQGTTFRVYLRRAQ